MTWAALGFGLWAPSRAEGLHGPFAMARDHRRLRVFHDAHALAVSIPNNIVEGSARWTAGEYFQFLNIARGSAAETRYLIELSLELALFSDAQARSLLTLCDAVTAQLQALLAQVHLLGREDDLRKAKGRKPRIDRP